MSLEFAQHLVAKNHLKTFHQSSRKDEIGRLKDYKVISLKDVEELKKQGKEPDMTKVGLEEVTLKDLVVALRRKCMHCQRAPRLL